MDNMSEEHLDPPEHADSSPPTSLPALLARGGLASADIEQFKTALVQKHPTAERAATLLAEHWKDLPFELRLEVVRWCWEPRVAKSCATATFILGAGIAELDPANASTMLDKAMKAVAKLPVTFAGTKVANFKTSDSDIRDDLRTKFCDLWLRPIETAPLFKCKYISLSNEARPQFDAVIMEFLESQPETTRDLVAQWLDADRASTLPADRRHAVESLLNRVRRSNSRTDIPPLAPTPAERIQSQLPESAKSESKAPVTNTGIQTISQPTHSKTVTEGSRQNPRAAIQAAVHTIQLEIKRWDQQFVSEVTSLRLKVTELEESLKRSTRERDDNATSLAALKDRCENLERSSIEATEKRDRALQVADQLQAELSRLNERVHQLESSNADATRRGEQLKADLDRVKEDKRRDVEYTRVTERAAMAQDISRAASIHMENIHELIQSVPSEELRNGLRSCHEELKRVLRPPSTSTKD